MAASRTRAREPAMLTDIGARAPNGSATLWPSLSPHGRANNGTRHESFFTLRPRRDRPSTSTTSSMRVRDGSDTSTRSRASLSAGPTGLTRFSAILLRYRARYRGTIVYKMDAVSQVHRGCVRRDGHALSFLTLTTAPRSAFNWTVTCPTFASEAPHGPFSKPPKLVGNPPKLSCTDAGTHLHLESLVVWAIRGRIKVRPTLSATHDAPTSPSVSRSQQLRSGCAHRAYGARF